MNTNMTTSSEGPGTVLIGTPNAEATKRPRPSKKYGSSKKKGGGGGGKPK